MLKKFIGLGVYLKNIRVDLGVGKVSFYCYKVIIYVLFIIIVKLIVKGLLIFGYVVVLIFLFMYRNRFMLEKLRVLWIFIRFENFFI